MFFEGYTPAFWSQEYVQKIVFENFPSAKINDITAFHCMNFQDVVIADGSLGDLVLYFGYVSSFDGSNLSLYCLNLVSSGITVETGGFDFPVLVLASDGSVPALFTGWKIVLNAFLQLAFEPAVPPVEDGIFTSQFNSVFQ